MNRKGIVRKASRLWRDMEGLIAALQVQGMTRSQATAAIRYYAGKGMLTQRKRADSDVTYYRWAGAPRVTVRVDRTQAKVAAEDHTTAIRRFLHGGFKVVVEDDGQAVEYVVTAQLADVVRR